MLQFVNPQRPRRFGNRPLAMPPFGVDTVQPGPLARHGAPTMRPPPSRLPRRLGAWRHARTAGRRCHAALPPPATRPFALPLPPGPSATQGTVSARPGRTAPPQHGGACPVCRGVTAPNTPAPWALEPVGLAHVGASGTAGRRSRDARGAGRGGSPPPQPDIPGPHREGRTPAFSGAHTTFFFGRTVDQDW